MKRNLIMGGLLLAGIAGLGVGSLVFENQAAAQSGGVQAPRFEVDPLWPQPLPNHWILGNTIGV